MFPIYSNFFVNSNIDTSRKWLVLWPRTAKPDTQLCNTNPNIKRCKRRINGLHLYSTFIQSTVQCMPLIHPFTHTFTHQRRLTAMQGGIEPATLRLPDDSWAISPPIKINRTCLFQLRCLVWQRTEVLSFWPQISLALCLFQWHLFGV